MHWIRNESESQNKQTNGQTNKKQTTSPPQPQTPKQKIKTAQTTAVSCMVSPTSMSKKAQRSPFENCSFPTESRFYLFPLGSNRLSSAIFY